MVALIARGGCYLLILVVILCCWCILGRGMLVIGLSLVGGVVLWFGCGFAVILLCGWFTLEVCCIFMIEFSVINWRLCDLGCLVCC